MPRWIRAVRLEEAPENRGVEIVAEGRVLAIFRVGDRAFALDGLCCHQGGPLGKGPLAGFVATCPWHGWQYDVRTGRHVATPSICQPSFPTRVEDGWIEVEFPDEADA